MDNEAKMQSLWGGAKIYTTSIRDSWNTDPPANLDISYRYPLSVVSQCKLYISSIEPIDQVVNQHPSALKKKIWDWHVSRVAVSNLEWCRILVIRKFLFVKDGNLKAWLDEPVEQTGGTISKTTNLQFQPLSLAKWSPFKFWCEIQRGTRWSKLVQRKRQAVSFE